ncbi:MAG TPA: exopolysaccharide biosynthesis polyprenyl glycosylphosphotransferase [Acidimicrobiia bacterium]|nr:exopolysaccharide biosynthesis polyprenyl glycosylphosphotransferase [Acidimicrobiia bacterium]
MVKTPTKLYVETNGHTTTTTVHRDDITVISDQRATPVAGLGVALRVAVPVADFAALIGGLVVVGGAGWAGVAYALLAILTLALFGDYRDRIDPHLDRRLWWVLGHLAVPLVFIGLVLTGEAARSLVLSMPLAAGLLVGGRSLVYAVTRWARRRGYVSERTLIVGAGEVGLTIAHALFRFREYGLRPVGLLDDVDEHLVPNVLGSCHGFDRVLEEHHVSKVVVAFGTVPEERLVPILRGCAQHDAEVFVTPRFFELGVGHAAPGFEDVRGIPLVPVRQAAFRRSARATKRAFDVAASSVALLLLSPALLVIATLVRLSGRGPIFFRQQRVGEDGRVFDVFKFRTLRPNDDSDMTWSVKDDDRVTAVGRVLRRTSLDELPQFFNVLRGDMSIVGPRPERPYFFHQFAEEIRGYRDRQRLPSGVTGWAQVHGLRGDTSIVERSRFDNHYIENWSPWMDLVICARTLKTLLRDHD